MNHSEKYRLFNWQLYSILKLHCLFHYVWIVRLSNWLTTKVYQVANDKIRLMNNENKQPLLALHSTDHRDNIRWMPFKNAFLADCFIQYYWNFCQGYAYEACTKRKLENVIISVLQLSITLDETKNLDQTEMNIKYKDWMNAIIPFEVFEGKKARVAAQ